MWHRPSGQAVRLPASASGEIGRHAGFRFLCLRAWGFKSPLAHRYTNTPGFSTGGIFLLKQPGHSDGALGSALRTFN